MARLLASARGLEIESQYRRRTQHRVRHTLSIVVELLPLARGDIEQRVAHDRPKRRFVSHRGIAIEQLDALDASHVAAQTEPCDARGRHTILYPNQLTVVPI
jgi:hypothetical protein